MIVILLWAATFVGQPIAFSHKQHAAQSCDSCHKIGPSGEVFSLPTAKDCQACHADRKDLKETITWVRVYELPSFVDFNHQAHIAAGAKCETCHGPVATRDRLTLETDISMGGCMECHRTTKATTSCTGCHHLS